MEHPHLLPPLVTPGDVITFYSHRGGAGRSMALANIATLLAGRAHAASPTLMVDWDLEAPGLHHYFQVSDDGPGVLDFFLACRDQLLRRGGRPAARDDTDLARQVLSAVGWERYVLRVDQSRPLYLMRAGRQDAGYAERLAGLDWEALFHACPALFRSFAAMLARHFRQVLVDARSGRADSSGICTTLLPTRLVLLFEPNRQSLDGLHALVQRATTYRRSHEDEQRMLLVYPLPARADAEDSAQRARCRRGDPASGLPGYQPVFERVLGEAYGVSQLSLESYFDEVQLQQTRSLAGGERLAVRDEPLADRFSVTRAYESFLDWLAGGHPPWHSRREITLLAAVCESRRALEEGAAHGMMLARDLYRLGLVYAEEGRRAAAMLSFRESADYYADVMGEEHLDTAAAKAQLARVLLQDGQLDQARVLLRSVAETRTRLLGAEHPDVLEAIAAQAAALARQGYFEAALDRQDAVLQVQLRRLGQEHAETLASQAARAAILYQSGELELARQAQEQVLAVRARLLGAEHGDTIAVAHALEQTLARMEAGVAAGDPAPPRDDGATLVDGAVIEAGGGAAHLAGLREDAAPYFETPPLAMRHAGRLPHEHLAPEPPPASRVELR